LVCFKEKGHQKEKRIREGEHRSKLSKKPHNLHAKRLGTQAGTDGFFPGREQSEGKQISGVNIKREKITEEQRTWPNETWGARDRDEKGGKDPVFRTSSGLQSSFFGCASRIGKLSFWGEQR